MLDGRNGNHVALALLIAAKIFGIAGLILGATNYRLLGGVLLGFDGVLLIAAVVVGLKVSKKRAVEESGHKDALEQMVREGTLDQYLRDIRARAASAPDSDNPQPN